MAESLQAQRPKNPWVFDIMVNSGDPNTGEAELDRFLGPIGKTA